MVCIAFAKMRRVCSTERSVAITRSEIICVNVSEKIEDTSASFDCVRATAMRSAATSMMTRCIFAIFFVRKNAWPCARSRMRSPLRRASTAVSGNARPCCEAISDAACSLRSSASTTASCNAPILRLLTALASSTWRLSSGRSCFSNQSSHNAASLPETLTACTGGSTASWARKFVFT